MKALIIGNGIAGVNVAAELRALEPDPGKLEIEIHAKEAWDFYSRIRLPEVISSGLGPQDIALYKEEWYKRRSIEVRKSHSVARILTDTSQVEFQDGQRLAYDVLAICTGSRPMRFPAPGIDKAGIDCLRTYDDARDLRAAIQAGRKRMAVVGGGLLGLEAAYHLKLAGVEDVCVIEIAERLLPRQLDAAAAGILRTLLEERGLSFRLGAKVEAYEGGEAVSGLRLASGETIGAEGVLLSSGVSPETELAKAAGIACGRGISVDCFMRSFAKGVFAAGDAAEFEGRSWGIIPAALEQARAAARAMLGDLGSPYVQTLPKTSLKVAGIDLLSMGLAVPAPEEEASLECVIRQDEEGSRYEKFILREGILVGAILLGSKKNQAWAGAAMGKPIRKEDIPGL